MEIIERLREIHNPLNGKSVELPDLQWQLFVLLYNADHPLSVGEIAMSIYDGDEKTAAEKESAARSLIARLKNALAEIDLENKLAVRRTHGYVIMRS